MSATRRPEAAQAEGERIASPVQLRLGGRIALHCSPVLYEAWSPSRCPKSATWTWPSSCLKVGRLPHIGPNRELRLANGSTSALAHGTHGLPLRRSLARWRSGARIDFTAPVSDQLSSECPVTELIRLGNAYGPGSSDGKACAGSCSFKLCMNWIARSKHGSR